MKESAAASGEIDSPSRAMIGNQNFQGMLDEINVHTRALSDSEIETLAASGLSSMTMMIAAEMDEPALSRRVEPSFNDESDAPEWDPSEAPETQAVPEPSTMVLLMLGLLGLSGLWRRDRRK